VQALRQVVRHGLVEVRLADGSSGLVDAGRLALGDQLAARRAYCTYNAGLPPENGAVLERRGTGDAQLQVENHGSEPAVIRLRDPADVVAAGVFVAPGRSATVTGLPNASYRPEFAAGELWSQVCHGFSAGMRAQRFAEFAPLPALSPLIVPPPETSAIDIPDAVFERE